MLALSGNPASALTNLQCVCMPALRKMAGYRDYGHVFIDMKSCSDFVNKGGNLRLLRGHVIYEKGEVWFSHPGSQGNAVISSAAGINAYAVVEPGAAVNKGELMKGFLI